MQNFPFLNVGEPTADSCTFFVIDKNFIKNGLDLIKKLQRVKRQSFDNGVSVVVCCSLYLINCLQGWPEPLLAYRNLVQGLMSRGLISGSGPGFAEYRHR